MKGFTLFSGGGGVDIAMHSLGVEFVGGVEYDDKIAGVARANGLHTTTADILECNPADFPAHDWLHASPPCPNFSNANAGAGETENDLNLARKVAEWITVHKPQVFTLENVIAYRKSQSWRIILETLSASGYWVDVAHVNFADFGVAQTRRRMIVRAKLGAFIPYLRPTHDKNGRNGLPRWIGWYEAIEDLIPTLPLSTKRGACTFARNYLPEIGHWRLIYEDRNEIWDWIVEREEIGDTCPNTPECRGHFAKWQESRLPAEFGTLLVNTDSKMGRVEQDQPCFSVVSSSRMSDVSAILVKNGDNYAPTPDGETPSFTVSATNSARAFIMNEGNPNGNEKRKYREDAEPTKTVTAGGMVTRAFVVNGTPNDYGKSVTVNKENAPIFTQTASSEKRPQRASINGRIVKMTPQAIARFQGFPDWYNLPDNASLAVRILGNAVPPVGFAAVCRDLF